MEEEAIVSSIETSVRPLRAEDRQAWSDFVDQHAGASFFHDIKWHDIVAGSGNRPHFLIATAGDIVRGVLPLARVRSRLFGDALISLPFCTHAAALGADDETALKLDNGAIDLAARLGVDYLEMRRLNGARTDMQTKDLYYNFFKSLSEDDDENLKAIPRKQRAMVRKGIAAGLRTEIDQDVTRFFPIYARSVRNLGTPVLARSHFQRLVESFGDRCEVAIVLREDEPVSAVLSFYHRGCVMPYYGGGTPAARECKAFDFMYWDLMCRAVKRGCREFDYGRSKKGTGAFSFKKNWGFEPRPLPYQYHMPGGGALPDVSPSNPRYALFIRLWKQLPLPIANRVGPLLARKLS
ncbi:MAG: FemAB family PEP-CTERM system-associated protein [Gammaproteobacteria bacterium]|nr:FemAB family PEP-CTERM system-associated protein [Gammaproteobacteria bacterium]NNM00603.1 FemAB family PEP-CTERM system-associated protein [Gammaproteobacteria bacterium]